MEVRNSLGSGLCETQCVGGNVCVLLQLTGKPSLGHGYRVATLHEELSLGPFILSVLNTLITGVFSNKQSFWESLSFLLIFGIENAFC